MLIGRAEDGWRNADGWSNGQLPPFDKDLNQPDVRRGGGELRVSFGSKLRSAATRLRHLAAVAVHGTAAGALFVAHPTVRSAGKHRRCREEQDKNRNEADEAAHCNNYIPQSFAVLSRREFAITDTELKLMAPAAIIGLSSRPKKGKSTPAASGTPIAL